LAQRLAYLILNPELRVKMGKAARAKALRFAWKSIGNDILSLYQGIIAEPIEHGQANIIDLEKEFLSSLAPNLEPAALSLFNMS
jgi:hypothetical protein